MNAKTPAELALKVWGALRIVEALASLPTALLVASTAVGSGSPDAALFRGSQIGFILGVVIQALAGLAVMLYADRMVAWFEADTTPLNIGMDVEDVATLAFALLGVSVLISGLQRAAVPAYAFFGGVPLPADERLRYLWERHTETLVQASIQIAAGAFLVFGRRTAVATFLRVREADSNEDDV